MAEQKTCGYTAYDVKKASQPPGVEYVRTINEQGNYSGKGVIARMKISQPKGHSTAFFLATDKFFGPVLCPIKMHSRFDEHSTILEVFKIIQNVLIFYLKVLAVFSYEYQHSKWIVFSTLSEDDAWTKVNFN